MLRTNNSVHTKSQGSQLSIKQITKLKSHYCKMVCFLIWTFLTSLYPSEHVFCANFGWSWASGSVFLKIFEEFSLFSYCILLRKGKALHSSILTPFYPMKICTKFCRKNAKSLRRWQQQRRRRRRTTDKLKKLFQAIQYTFPLYCSVHTHYPEVSLSCLLWKCSYFLSKVNNDN